MLHHQCITDDGSNARSGETPPTHAMLFLHGILGRGTNWQTIAKRFVAKRPEYAAVLVDLRAHGESLAAIPPDTLAACAEDLGQLVAHLQETKGWSTKAVLGHSFGGKVALAYAEALHAQSAPAATSFIIDSTPSARPSKRGSETVLAVLEALRATEGATYESRRAFVKAMGERGIAQGVAMWLGMNLKSTPQESTLHFGLDLDRIDALLLDYFHADYWETLERGPAHLVIGTRSEVVAQADQARAEAAEGVTVHRLDAGHWVHVDAPQPLVSLLTQYAPN